MDSLPLISNRSHQKYGISRIRLRSDFPKRQSYGFTLLELLAVVFIIGIIVSFAGLSIGQRSSHLVQDEAERLNGLLRLASEEAVLQGRELALELDEGSYHFLELGTDNKWLPVEEDALFRQRSLPPNVKIDLSIEGAAASFEDKKNLPRIFVLSSGELTPFKLTLSLDEEEAYTLQGAIDGKIDLSHKDDSGDHA